MSGYTLLNTLLKNEEDFCQLTEIYYHSKRAANLITFIQSLNADVDDSKQHQYFNSLANLNPPFSDDERTSIANALHIGSGDLDRTGWNSVAKFAPSLLLPLLRTIGHEANLATQLISFLMVPDTHGDTGWHALASGAHKVLARCMEIIAQSEAAMQQFLAVFSIKNNKDQTPWFLIFNKFTDILPILAQYFPKADRVVSKRMRSANGKIF
ncbi:MAG: hypothetical protein HKM04_02755 [Legionellales bacterium]|nr:hypothetical protein [Legionellales bacterium]